MLTLILCLADETQKKHRHQNELETKSLTDEFVDFIEELTEEIMEVINPDDD